MSEITMLTVLEVAKRLTVNKQTIYRLCEHNMLTSYRIGVGRGTLRIDEKDLEAYLRRAKPVIGFTHGSEHIRLDAPRKRANPKNPKRPPERR